MTEQELQADLGLKDLLKIYLSQWRLFAFVFLILAAVAGTFYATRVPYVSTTQILANDSQNSSLQAFSSQFFGLSKSVEESKKGSSLLSKHVEYLKTQAFLNLLVEALAKKGVDPELTLPEQQAFEKLNSEYFSTEQKSALKAKLAKWLQIRTTSEFEVIVSALTEDKGLSLLISKTASQLSVEVLKNREKEELLAVEKFVTEQKASSEKKLEKLSQQVADLELDESQLVPLASKERMGDYVSELLVRANELKLKIRENKKTIEYLNNNRTSARESALYGVGGKIEALRMENKLLQGRLDQVQSSMAQLKSQAKSLPYAAQMLEDLKKKSDLEFERYKEFDSVLNKLEAQKISVQTRFDISEPARLETTQPQVQLMTLLFAAFLFSQLLASLVVYFRLLWNPETVTAQASRNLVIFDNHSADPRVIIENSKIRFSLRKPEIKAVEDLDSESSKMQRLSNFKTQQATEGPSQV